MTRIVFGISGASGMPLAQAVLQSFRSLPDLEIHLIISRAARQTILAEGMDLGDNPAQLEPDNQSGSDLKSGQTGINEADKKGSQDENCDPAEKADHLLGMPEHFAAHARYDPDDFAAPFASGSWLHAGMVICPCSMSSLGAIANGVGTNLLHRAADVCLKERRPLILVARETPLNLIHLRNMVCASEAGATIMPFVPAFYTGHARNGDFIRQAMRQFAGRILDQMRIPHTLCKRWGGK